MIGLGGNSAGKADDITVVIADVDTNGHGPHATHKVTLTDRAYIRSFALGKYGPTMCPHRGATLSRCFLNSNCKIKARQNKGNGGLESTCKCSRAHTPCLLTFGVAAAFFYMFTFALTVIPGPPLFSLTIRLPNLFPCPVTFVTGQRLLKAELPGQCESPLYCGQRNSTKFAPAPP